LFTNNFKFGHHISAIFRKANSITGIVKISFNCLSPSMFKILCTSLIRPHLDYASVVWSPYQLGDIHKIEKAQRQATKILPEFWDYSYYERLTELNLPSLLYCRRRMMVYKIIHCVDGCLFDKLFTFSDFQSTRSNCLNSLIILMSGSTVFSQ